MKNTTSRILVGSAEGTPNPGENNADAMKVGPNGKGIGELPGYNQRYMEEAEENTNPMEKHEKVGSIVGE